MNLHAAHRPILIENEDFYLGNGKGAPVAEQVANYVHKDEQLNYFSQRRARAIRQLYAESGGKRILTGIVEEMLKTKYDLLPMNPDYAQDDGERINFLTRSGLEKCQKFLINGKFYHYTRYNQLGLYSSDEKMTLNGFTGDVIVMDQQGNIFIHPKKMRAIHHSSFFSQKAIAFGAMVRIKNGVIVNENSKRDELHEVALFPERDDTPHFGGLMYYSGHYDPIGANKNHVKQGALNNFKKELAKSHFAWYTIISEASGKALDARGNGLFSKWVGQERLHHPSHDQYSHQLWELVKVDDKHFMIISNRYGRALDCSEDNKFVPTEPVHSPSHDDYKHQLWKIEEVGDSVIITSKYSKKALDSWKGKGRVLQYPEHDPDHKDFERHLWKLVRG